VVGEHARVRADRLERVDHRPVQRRLGTGHGRAEDGGPRDLVAERDPLAVPVDEAGGGQQADGRRRHAERVQQFGADRFGCAGEQLEATAHLGRQPGGPGEHGVPDARGHRGVRLGEDLAEEERVACGPAVDVGRVEPVSVDERGDGRPTQRGQLHAARARRGDQVAEDRAQRMVDPHRVAIGQHQQQGQARDPAGEEPHEVERRLVGPVQVLHHEHSRTRTQGVEHRREDLVLGRGAAQQCGHRRAQLVRDVAQRPQRAGGAQRVAHAPQRLRARLLDEGAQQDGLADARLAGDEDDGAVAGDGAASALVEQVKGVLAFQELHADDRRSDNPRCPLC